MIGGVYRRISGLCETLGVSAGAGFARHLETMLSELESRPGARLPGARRAEAQAQARAKGIVVSADLLLQNIALSH